jgi:hypothetical protein
VKRIDRLLRKRKPKLQDPNFISRLRVREIERIIRHRWGVVPDTDDADHTIRLVAYHLKPLARKSLAAVLSHWCHRWAPHIPQETIRGIAWQVNRWPRDLKADTLAQHLRLTDAERTRLGITTIGAIDMNHAKRRQRRAKRQQTWKKKARMSNPSYRSREEYLANSLSRTKPWKAEGISRATWYRRQRETGPATRETGPETPVYNYAVSQPVSPPPAWLLTSPAWSKPRWDTPYGPVSPLTPWLALLMQAEKSRSHSAIPTETSMSNTYLVPNVPIAVATTA